MPYRAGWKGTLNCSFAPKNHQPAFGQLLAYMYIYANRDLCYLQEVIWEIFRLHCLYSSVYYLLGLLGIGQLAFSLIFSLLQKGAPDCLWSMAQSYIAVSKLSILYVYVCDIVRIKQESQAAVWHDNILTGTRSLPLCYHSNKWRVRDNKKQ